MGWACIVSYRKSKTPLNISFIDERSWWSHVGVVVYVTFAARFIQFLFFTLLWFFFFGILKLSFYSGKIVIAFFLEVEVKVLWPVGGCGWLVDCYVLFCFLLLLLLISCELWVKTKRLKFIKEQKKNLKITYSSWLASSSFLNWLQWNEALNKSERDLILWFWCCFEVNDNRQII